MTSQFIFDWSKHDLVIRRQIRTVGRIFRCIQWILAIFIGPFLCFKHLTVLRSINCTLFLLKFQKNVARAFPAERRFLVFRRAGWPGFALLYACLFSLRGVIMRPRFTTGDIMPSLSDILSKSFIHNKTDHWLTFSFSVKRQRISCRPFLVIQIIWNDW